MTDKPDRDWKHETLEKFTDVLSPSEFKGQRMRRHLPPVMPYRQNVTTPDLELRREAEERFRIKRAK